MFNFFESEDKEKIKNKWCSLNRLSNGLKIIDRLPKKFEKRKRTMNYYNGYFSAESICDPTLVGILLHELKFYIYDKKLNSHEIDKIIFFILFEIFIDLYIHTVEISKKDNVPGVGPEGIPMGHVPCSIPAINDERFPSKDLEKSDDRTKIVVDILIRFANDKTKEKTEQNKKYIKEYLLKELEDWKNKAQKSGQ